MILKTEDLISFLDESQELINLYWDRDAALSESANSISVTVSSETDLKNLKKRDRLTYDLLNLVDFRVDQIYFHNLLVDIKRLNQLIDEMESPKDKFLLMKEVKDLTENLINGTKNFRNRGYMKRDFESYVVERFIKDSIRTYDNIAADLERLLKEA
jgi:hypothetical protein